MHRHLGTRHAEFLLGSIEKIDGRDHNLAQLRHSATGRQSRQKRLSGGSSCLSRLIARQNGRKSLPDRLILNWLPLARIGRPILAKR